MRKARPGFTVVIAGGTYDERVVFSRSGTASAPITFAAERPGSVTVTRGFRITGDHNVIRGLTISPGETDQQVFASEQSTVTFNPWTTGQVQVKGSNNVVERIAFQDKARKTPRDRPSLVFVGGSGNVVRDIDFHDCPGILFAGAGGGEPKGSGEGNTLSGGTLHHTNALLVGIEADRSTVENVDMHDPGQVEKGPDAGNAADGINLNGAGIVIRGNRIHGIFQQVRTQHTDAIQWWNTADGLVLEGNVIGSAGSGGDLGRRDHGHIEWTSENPGKSSQGVMIRNNVFLGTDGDYVINGSAGQTIPGQADDWRIVGNTFAGRQYIRGDLFENTRGWVVADNVFFATGTIRGRSRTFDYNVYIGVEPSNADGAHSFSASSAGFARPDVSAATRFGVEADWRPRSGSPLVKAGVARQDVQVDASGVPRGDPPSIGAYEVAK